MRFYSNPTDSHFADVFDTVKDGHVTTQAERTERGFEDLDDRLVAYAPDRPKGEHYGA